MDNIHLGTFKYGLYKQVVSYTSGPYSRLECNFYFEDKDIFFCLTCLSLMIWGLGINFIC